MTEPVGIVHLMQSILWQCVALLLAVLLAVPQTLATGKLVRKGNFAALSDEAFKELSGLISEDAFRADGPLLKRLLQVRVPDTPANRDVRKFIVDHYKALNYAVEEDCFKEATPHGEKEFCNVIAKKHAAAPTRLILAAHFDSKYFPEPNNFVGATDSAGPVAILMHMATVLQPYLDRLMSPDTTVEFVFFDGEEAFETWTDKDSLYGSRHLAARWEKELVSVPAGLVPESSGAAGLLSRRTADAAADPAPVDDFFENAAEDIVGVARTATVSRLETIRALVLLDLLGAEGGAVPNFYEDTTTLFEMLQSVQARARKSGLTKFALFTTSSALSNHAVSDDHIPFETRNVPIVHVIPIPFPAVWHTPRDDGKALIPAKLRDICLMFSAFLSEYLVLL